MIVIVILIVYISIHCDMFNNSIKCLHISHRIYIIIKFNNIIIYWTTAKYMPSIYALKILEIWQKSVKETDI